MDLMNSISVFLAYILEHQFRTENE